VLGAVIMLLAVKDGVVFDMKLLIMVVVSSTAIICSWLARIEASMEYHGNEL
jgi:hypothetical protein